MPYTVVDRLNILGKYQQELFLFTDCKGQIIVDCDVNIIRVNGGGDENDAILTIKRIKGRSVPSRRTKLFNSPPK